MNRRLAPSCGSGRPVNMGSFVIGKGRDFSVDLGQIDRNAMWMTVFWLPTPNRHLRFNHAYELILEKQFVGVGHYFQWIKIVLCLK